MERRFLPSAPAFLKKYFKDLPQSSCNWGKSVYNVVEAQKAGTGCRNTPLPVYGETPPYTTAHAAHCSFIITLFLSESKYPDGDRKNFYVMYELTAQVYGITPVCCATFGRNTAWTPGQADPPRHHYFIALVMICSAVFPQGRLYLGIRRRHSGSRVS